MAASHFCLQSSRCQTKPIFSCLHVSRTGVVDLSTLLYVAVEGEPQRFCAWPLLHRYTTVRREAVRCRTWRESTNYIRVVNPRFSAGELTDVTASYRDSASRAVANPLLESRIHFQHKSVSQKNNRRV